MQIGKLVSAKRKYNPFNKALSIGTGGPDFIDFKKDNLINVEEGLFRNLYQVIGVEAKSNGYLDKKEKEMCKWLLENNIFSKILIASKSKQRGKIDYKEIDLNKK